MEKTNKSIHIVSYPRSGSSYMIGLFSVLFNLSWNDEYVKDQHDKQDQIFKNHLFTKDDCEQYNISEIENFKKNNFVISILRDPIDTFTSLLCQELFFDKSNVNDVFLNRIINTNPNESLLMGYESFWNYVSTFSDLILNYDDINIYRNNIVEYVSDKTGHKIKKHPDGSLFWDDEYMKDEIEFKFIRSTKNYKEYSLIKQKLQNVNLNNCYQIYEKILLQCKNFK